MRLTLEQNRIDLHVWEFRFKDIDILYFYFEE